MSRSSTARRRARTLAGAAGLTLAGVVAGLVGPATPVGAEAERTHRVRPGDTLSEVAEDLGTSTAALAAANGIADPDVVAVGRLLRVPASAQAAAGPSIVPAGRRHLDATFDRWAEANGISPSLLKALCYQESGWQAHVVSSAGADGVCQLMPDTEDHMEALIGRELDSQDAEDNIRLGARFLRWLLARTDGDVRQAVGAYYQGLAALREHGPYDETVQYVDTVLALRERFR